MPLVSTLVAMHLLQDVGTPRPFTDPELLRRLLRGGLDINDPALPQALGIADRLESLQEDYLAQMDQILDAYIEESTARYLDTAQLEGRLATIDQVRMQLLREAIEWRQALNEILDDNQWQAVFGQRAARGWLPNLS